MVRSLACLKLQAVNEGKKQRERWKEGKREKNGMLEPLANRKQTNIVYN